MKGRSFLNVLKAHRRIGGRYAMKTHVGVDLHQRFCYLTAVNASGKVSRDGAVPEYEKLRAKL